MIISSRSPVEGNSVPSQRAAVVLAGGPLRPHTPRGGTCHQRQQVRDRPAEPGRLVVGPLLAQQLAQLRGREGPLLDEQARRLGEFTLVDAAEVTAVQAGCAAVQHGLQDRPKREAVAAGDQVQGAAHQMRPHHAAVGDHLAELVDPEALQS
jgi:hypothetical protein